MFLALITRPHLAVSFFSSVASSAGLEGAGSAPDAISRAVTGDMGFGLGSEV
jgi:hypothetical protein